MDAVRTFLFCFLLFVSPTATGFALCFLWTRMYERRVESIHDRLMEAQLEFERNGSVTLNDSGSE